MNEIGATLERMASRGEPRGARVVLRDAVASLDAVPSARPEVRGPARRRKNWVLGGAVACVVAVVAVAVLSIGGDDRASRVSTVPGPDGVDAARRFSIRPIVATEPLPCGATEVAGAGAVVGCFGVGPSIVDARDVVSASARHDPTTTGRDTRWEINVELRPDAVSRLRQLAAADPTTKIAVVIGGAVRAAPRPEPALVGSRLTFTDPSFTYQTGPVLAASIAGDLGTPRIPMPTKGRLPPSDANGLDMPKGPNYVSVVAAADLFSPVGFLPNVLLPNGPLSCPASDASPPCVALRDRVPQSSGPQPVYAEDLVTVVGNLYPYPTGYVPLGERPEEHSVLDPP